MDVVELLTRLVRIDTTNPPGDEGPAVDLIADVLADAGVASRVLADETGRPNLLARLPGRGDAPPLLLQGHIDVVPTTDQPWTRDPFGAEIIDEVMWGRGTLDMKSGVAMMVDAVTRLARDGVTPAGDVIMAIVADEEVEGTHGARFLVEHHAHEFEGVRYAIGEFGGFSYRLGGTTFYPVQVAERTGVRMDVTFTGPAGHGSMPISGGAMAKLGRALVRLDRGRLPVHLTPATRMMLETIAEQATGLERVAVRGLLDERTAGPTLRAAGDRLRFLEPLLRNTASPTVVRGGEARNVIPPEVTLTLDGRMLPGMEPDAFRDEIVDLLGDDAQIQISSTGSGVNPDPDMGLFGLLADLLTEMDPSGVPLPFMTPAVTDARWFSRLGVQCYGFTPMILPADFDFQSTIHGADERIPVAAVRAGADAMHRLLVRYPC